MCVTGKQIMVVREQADICLKMHNLIKNWWLIKKRFFFINFDNWLWILPNFETLKIFLLWTYPLKLSILNFFLFLRLKIKCLTIPDSLATSIALIHLAWALTVEASLPAVVYRQIWPLPNAATIIPFHIPRLVHGSL